MQAEQLAKQKMWSEAADLCNQARDVDPTNLSVLDQLGWYLSRAKRYAEAINVFKELIELEPQKAKWPYMIGYQFYDQENWGAAIEWFKKSLILHPNYIVVLYRKGYAHTKIREDEEATKSFLKVAEIWQGLDVIKREKEQKNYSDSIYQLGKLYLTKGLTRKAEFQFSEAVKFDQQDGHKYYGYGKALLKNLKFKEARIQLEKAISIEPRKDYIKDCLAQAYAGAGDAEKGLEILDGIPTRYRKHYVWRTLGELYFEKEDFQNSVRALKHAVQEQVTNHNYLLLLAKAHLGNNEPEKAVPLLEKAIELRKKKYNKEFQEAESLLSSIHNDFPNIERVTAPDGAVEEEAGTIKLYKDDKGYGFISSKKLDKDLFFHVSSVSNPDFIEQGRGVQFDVEETEKGLNAVNVKVLETV